jgi:hypothetical protein
VRRRHASRVARPLGFSAAEAVPGRRPGGSRRPRRPRLS